ncbi:MAG TPA: hypothetical protein VMI55_03420 [Thermoplasmata archaeon]|nr:hypothetical protein [Thermoplasmata archaeon]
MSRDSVLEWLLEPEQPSVQYLALTQLLGRKESDSEVKEAKSRIPREGWAATILADRNPAGWWVRDWSHFSPSYTSTTWMMVVLSDLGLTRELPEVRHSAELWMRMKPLRYGPVVHPSVEPHYCSLGMGAAALIRLGYGDDPRVRRSLEWIVKKGHPQGGWSHFGSGRNLDAWQGLGALASLPRSKRTAAMQRSAELGAEFFLERELHRQGPRYEPWYRFHYPVFYFYDILVGLEMMTGLGYGQDPRMRFALSLLEKKRRTDGRWVLDSVHPDVMHPAKDKVVALEKAGAPSKIITLRALKVLARAG